MHKQWLSKVFPRVVNGVQSFPGSICVSGFATPVVNCGTARVPMGLPMCVFACEGRPEVHSTH